MLNISCVEGLLFILLPKTSLTEPMGYNFACLYPKKQIGF